MGSLESSHAIKKLELLSTNNALCDSYTPLVLSCLLHNSIDAHWSF